MLRAGVSELSDTVVQEVEKELAEEKRKCAECSNPDCQECVADGQGSFLGPPTAILLSETFAVVVVPAGRTFRNCWAGGSRCAEDTRDADHFALWLFARAR